MGWLIAVVVLVMALAVWVTWTATRLDRLNARVEAARASLDAHLVRRAASAQALADDDCPAVGRAGSDQLRAAAHAALTADAANREFAENDLGRVLAALGGDPGPDGAQRLVELRAAATRVSFARRFYNDAVRDLGDLRGQRMPRLLRLGARRPVPAFFEIDDRLWPDQPPVQGPPPSAVPWSGSGPP